MKEIFSAVFMVLGAMFMCLGGIGILRMPDLFMRMSCSTKASTLGVGFLMLSVAVKFTGLGVVSRSVAIIVFTILTASVAAHMIGRAAYIIEVALWPQSAADQLCDRYQRCTTLHGTFEVESTHSSHDAL
jgi:multicomponent Na+:H+ antiporter subunit G